MSMIIPEFKTEQDFYDFVSKTPDEEIQKMTFDDWMHLHENLKTIMGKDKQQPLLKTVAKQVVFHAAASIYDRLHRYSSKFKEAHPMGGTSNFTDASETLCFAKLYKNYRMEEKDRQELIELAFKSADQFMTQIPDGDKYCYLTFGKDELRKKKKIACAVRNAVYDTVYADDALARNLLPKVRIEEKGKNFAGNYEPIRDRVFISTNEKAGISTMAHEVLHSTQGMSFKHEVLRYLNRQFSSSSKFYTLYKFNEAYYFSSKTTRRGDDFNKRKRFFRSVYRHQPLEYSARLFGIMFRHRLHQHALFQYRVEEILKTSGFKTLDSYKTAGDPPRLNIVLPPVSGTNSVMFKELNEKYLLGDVSKQRTGRLVLSFDCDGNNFLRIKEEHNYFKDNVRECFGNKSVFMKKVLPETFAAQKSAAMATMYNGGR